METLIWSGLECVSSAALLGAYCVRMSIADAMTVWLGAMRTPCAIFAGVMVSSVLVGMTIRETQLFRFFKQRWTALTMVRLRMISLGPITVDIGKL